MTPRIVVVSDSHFSVRTPEADRNWDAVLRHVEATEPDLVLHVGDVTVDGARDPEELRLARQRLERLTTPYLVVPGNHDIGDNPSDGVVSDEDVTVERLARWSAVFGADRWLTHLGAWRLVGVDSLLFGSDTEDEEQQWAFLDEVLGDAQRTILVLHKPLTAGDPELASAPPYRFVPPPARDRLTELCHRGGVEVVLSGHVHQQRQIVAAGMTHLWATTTWAVLPDWLQAPIGVKRCGIVAMELPDHGALAPTWVEPEGMAQLTLGEDIPSPYEPAATEAAP